MFNKINESFDRKYQPLTESKVSDADLLKKRLQFTANNLLNSGNNNLKSFEIAFQDVIENFFPGCLWWEVTTCNIFMELFNTRDPLAVVDCIIANLTDEFKDGGLNDVLRDSTNKSIQASDDLVNESKSLNEDPLPFTFNDSDLNDPRELDFKKIIKRNADDDAKAKAEQERQERIAAAKERYKDVLININPDGDAEDNLEKLFNALVPSSGKSDTVAGELVRATMRILYRDWNDGDKFFMGYGLETCGGSAQYLYDMDVSSVINDILSDTDYYMDDDNYTSMLNKLSKDVVSYILNNPDSLAELNEVDSRDYHYDYIEDKQPKFDYDFMVPDDVQKYVDAGYVDTLDVESIIESNLDGNDISYESVEFNGGNYAYIYGLDYDSYEEVQRWEMYDDSYWSYEINEWESEFGNPDEEDDEDDDMDESKSLKESPVYDMTPQYDSRQSFYGKARVDDNGSEKTLYSYNTPVAKISDGKVQLLSKWDWSQTTLRHVKEFLKQNGFEANSLAQMRKDYL